MSADNAQTSESTTIDPLGLYQFSAFGKHVGITRKTWWQWQVAGRAPAPAFRPSKRLSLWRGADILFWLKDPTTYAERLHAAEKYVARRVDMSATSVLIEP